MKDVLKVFREVFTALIPAYIAAGLCAGFSSLVTQLWPGYASIPLLYVLYSVLRMINLSFSSFMNVWVGYVSVQKLGGTAIAGGMLGAIMGLDGISGLASLARGFFPTLLYPGGGGVVAIFIGTFLYVAVEKRVCRFLKGSLGSLFVPLLSLLAVVLPFIFIVMPVGGLVCTALCKGIEYMAMSPYMAVTILSGFLCAALFLPINMLGMNFALIALYTLQLDSVGYTSLYPVFAMAGASQTGMGIAVLLKARRAGNKSLSAVAAGGIVPGMLGVGTPLLYGVSLTVKNALLAACLGAGVGGVFIIFTKVASSGFGPSGLLALPMMTAGPHMPLTALLLYLAGWFLSLLSGFFLSWLMTDVKGA